MTYVCPAWELAADTYLYKLQKKVLRSIGNFPRCIPVGDLHTVSNFPYVYDCITKLCRQQAEVIQNHEDKYVHGKRQSEARHRKYKRLKFSFGQA
jgi:hypothetical protein